MSSTDEAPFTSPMDEDPNKPTPTGTLPSQRIYWPSLGCELFFYISLIIMFGMAWTGGNSGGREVLLLIAAMVAVPGLRAARKLRGYTLARIGFLFALFSFAVTLLGVLTAPLAIWGMVVLADSDVKRAFES